MGNVLSGKSMSEHHAVIKNFKKSSQRLTKILKISLATPKTVRHVRHPIAAGGTRTGT
jgi:hypothetical protein